MKSFPITNQLLLFPTPTTDLHVQQLGQETREKKMLNFFLIPEKTPVRSSCLYPSLA
jgi:hypothetical protein